MAEGKLLQLRGCCRHLGHQDGTLTCALGIDIRALVGGSSVGWLLRVPCNTAVSSPQPLPLVRCSKRDYLTPEEVAAEREKLNAAAAAFIEGRSPCCGAPMREAGSNRYCSKCGGYVGRVNTRR